MNRCQGMPWSEELDDNELHGALGGEYDLEPGGLVSPAHRQEEQTRPFRESTNMVLCWF